MAATKAGAMRTQRNRDRANKREWRKTAKESASADHVHRETGTVGERKRERDTHTDGQCFYAANQMKSDSLLADVAANSGIFVVAAERLLLLLLCPVANEL